MTTIFKHTIRPLFIARIQLREALRSMIPRYVGERMETISDASLFKFFPWIPWSKEYVCLSRVERNGNRVELYMKPGAELQVMIMQEALDNKIGSYTRKG